MRHEMEKVIKEEFKELVSNKRYALELSQAKMAEALAMSERSYEDIESGRSSCGTLTVLLILMKMENRDEFLAELYPKLEKAYALEPALT